MLQKPPPGAANGSTMFACVWPATQAITCG